MKEITVDTLLLADLVGAATHAVEGLHEAGHPLQAQLAGEAVEKGANILFDNFFTQTFERTISLDLFNVLVKCAQQWAHREEDETVLEVFARAVEDANNLWLRTMHSTFGHGGV